MANTALVLLSGGLAGAFSAGVMSVWSREDVLKKFSSIYCYSVGAYPATFSLADQPDIIEEVWRNNVDGLKLINPFNLLTMGHRPVLKLEYLERLFREEFCLDAKSALSKSTKLKYALIDFYHGELEFLTPTRDNIIELMSAASSVPFIHGPTEVDGRKFLDATFVFGSAPGIENIVENHDETVVIRNYPKGYVSYGANFLFRYGNSLVFPFIGKFYPEPLQKIFKNRHLRRAEVERYIESQEKITLLRPEKLHVRSVGDSNRKRINQSSMKE